MTDKLKRVKLKGNESFNFREGWLRKGMRCVKSEPNLFAKTDVMERLGVGSKMVKSIRFWLQATGLCEEKYTNSGKSRSLFLTEDFGEVVFERDPYFDDTFTLFLLHYHIVSSDALCMVWNIFFNEYEGQDFTKENMVESCKTFLSKKMAEACEFSDKSFEDDIASVIRMYTEVQSAASNAQPEDSLACPLNELGLLQKSTKVRNGLIKTMPSRAMLDKLAVLYVIVKNITPDKPSVSIDDLLNASNNIGKVFNLTRVSINEYLDQLRISGYISINRTAGLDMVYVQPFVLPKEVMIQYYNKAQV